jgi:predicted dehydrogenase
MIAAAEESGCFLMEALWTVFFPAMQEVDAALRAGRIGTPRLLTADFSYRATLGPASRLFNPALAGGALLDIGVYTVALADLVFGEEPESIQTTWTPAPTGVDKSAAVILEYGDGRRALLSTSLAFDAPQEARICGDSGTITLPHRFSQPDTYILEREGRRESISFPREGFGYHLEARAVTAAVRDGQQAHDSVSWDRSRRIARTLDRIRAKWGLRYPMEDEVP